MTTQKNVCITSEPCQAFTNGEWQSHDCIIRVDFITGEDVVWVYDSVAGHYTDCHKMPRFFQRRLFALAAKKTA